MEAPVRPHFLTLGVNVNGTDWSYVAQGHWGSLPTPSPCFSLLSYPWGQLRFSGRASTQKEAPHIPDVDPSQKESGGFG